MKLNPIIKALRERSPYFTRRVFGAAEFSNLPEKANVAVPSAFVVPLDDNAEPNRSNNGYRQLLKESFAVIVVVSNTADERGQDSSNAVDDARSVLWKALLGWEMTADHTPIEYQGGALVKMDRNRLWYQFEFGCEIEIGDGDTYQHEQLEALPFIEGIDVSVDMIDPAADPNIQSPGPDGRIEHKLKIDLPNT